MKAIKDLISYSPVTITFETYEEYRQFTLMLNFVVGNVVRHNDIAKEILEELNGLKKD